MIIVSDDYIDGKNAYIFSNPAIEQFTINYQNNLQPIHWLNGKEELLYGQRELSAEIKLMMTNIDVQSATKLKPEDLYSLPELIKMSKMITRKIKA